MENNGKLKKLAIGATLGAMLALNPIAVGCNGGKTDPTPPPPQFYY